MTLIGVLGPVGLLSDGSLHTTGTPKENHVLAVLALNCGRTVPTNTLIHRVWPGTPPANARTTLGSYITRLRGRLRSLAGATASIMAEADGYRLAADPDLIDVHRAERLRRQARSLADSGEREQARELFLQEDRLWRGEPLHGLAGPWVEAERLSLEEDRHAARLERLDLDLCLGRHALVVGELQRLAAGRPADEQVAALLMTALHRCERQADALAAYRRARRHLCDQHGTEPGPRLRDLHESILRGDGGPAAPPHRHGGTARINELPPVDSRFTGRKEELRGLLGAGDARITVITGMPGVGKTALAVRAAHRLARGRTDALFVTFDRPGAGPSSPFLHTVFPDLLLQLGIAPPRIPFEPERQRDLWRREATGRRLVIVLDDVVHLDQFRDVATGLPDCRVLVTSRRRLDAPAGSGHLPLAPLNAVDSRGLVTRVADDALDPATVDAIVEQCGGLPLALCLTAKSATREPAGAALPGLAPGEPDRSPVWEAFMRSYRTLNDEQRRFFRSLGSNPCADIGEEAAAALTGRPSTAVRAAFDVLRDQHLIEAPRQGRLRMHGLVRDFAYRLALTEDAPQEHRRRTGRLLTYYRRHAERADTLLFEHRRRLPGHGGASPVPGLTDAASAQDWLREEMDNALIMARHALEHGWERDGILIVHALAQCLEIGGRYERGVEVQDAAVRAARETDDLAAAARLLYETGFTHFRTSAPGRALPYLRDALAGFQTLRDKPGEADARDVIGIVLWTTAHYREALAHFRDAHALYAVIGDERGMTETMAHAGIALWHLGHYDDAEDHLRRSLNDYRAIGDERGEGRVVNNLGEINRLRGYHRDAAECYRRSGRIFARLVGPLNEAIVQNNLGNVDQYKGRYEDALRRYRTAIAVFQNFGDRRNTADVLNSIGATFMMEGRAVEAAAHYEKAERLAAEVEDPYLRALALYGIADAHHAAGRYPAAEEHFGRALTIARQISDPYQEARAHDGLARTALQSQGQAAARIHWLQSLDLFTRLGVPEAKTIDIKLQTMGGLAS
ncbi:Regulatory protein AfsR [Actinomadura rubteroloni]|uniref:Regulatory protein AfsR n=1 Tax=Actinomadura rubteroloni TaxID=1926885 RepID=A0A2P4URD1_9ACTN|nr:tetratricopeptide repeat protein [Actinomadura rubteroloni]POM27608.1 Regulatory protein AfsR [Actinomadura rubteroloni]